MIRRLTAGLVALTMLVFPLGVRAQSDTGEIQVTVSDASATDQPVSNARVTLVGPSIVSALTTKSGRVVYSDVPTGIYRIRVTKSAFQPAQSEEFQVLGGRAVKLQILLASDTGGLKVIGSVVARSSVAISSNDISEDSPVRRVSDGLADALNKIAGVSVNTASNDPDAAVTVSLRNFDESQTSVTLDGIPLSAPGVAANLRNVNTSLFSGASTRFGPSAGALGGSVNFRTLEPTQTWQERLNASYGTYDRASYAAGVTGSVGKLGIAVQHTWNGGNSPLTGESYLDQSGLVYAHGGENKSLGDGFKLRYSLGGNTTINVSALQSNTYSSPLCTRFTAALPCGIGPGNDNYGKFGFGYVTLRSLVGNIAFTASYFANSNTNWQLYNDRTISGVASPYAQQQSTSSHGGAVTASIAEKRHTFTLSANDFASNTTFTPLVGSQFVFSSSAAQSSRQVQFSDVDKATDKLSYTGSISYAGTTGVGSSLLGSLGSTWRPTSVDTYNATFAIGSSQPGPPPLRNLSDPSNAQYNCANGTVTVGGPGDTPQRQSALNYDVSWTHTLRRGQFSLDLYRQTQTGQTIAAAVAAGAEPIGYFPPGYLGTIGSVWSLPNVCGATPFSPASIYVNQPISGTSRLYQGVTASATIGLGPTTVLIPTYSLNVAQLTAADQRLASSLSTTIVGNQLPGRPLHRAGLTIDSQIPKLALEVLANAQYEGPNNARNLGAYTLVTAGVSHNVGPGRLTLLGNNLFNTYAGTFSTLDLGTTVTTNSGRVIQLAGQPVLPRNWTLSYTVQLGSKGASSPAVPGGGIFQGGRGRGGFGGPGNGPGGPGGGEVAINAPSAGGTAGAGANGQRRFNLRDLAPPAGVDPLSAANREQCDADAKTQYADFTTALRNYVTAFEANRSDLPSIPGFTPRGIRLAATAAVPYFILLQPQFTPGQGPNGANGTGNPGSARLGSPPPLPIGAQRPGPTVNQGNAAASPTPAPAETTLVVTSRTPNPNATPRAGGPNGQRGGNGAGRIFRTLFGCAYVTVYTYDEAKAKGLDVVVTRGLGLGYAPGIGLVAIQPKVLPEGGGSVSR